MMRRFQYKHILMIAVFIVLICSWAVGNIIHSAADLDNEQGLVDSSIFERWKEEIVLITVISLISTVPITGIYILYDKKGIELFSGILLIAFWIAAFLAATIFVILFTASLGGDIEFFWLPSEGSLQFLPFVGKLGIWILLFLLAGLFTLFVYLKIEDILNKEKEGEKPDIKTERDWDLQAEEKEKIEEDLTSTVDRAITYLHKGQDVRSTIIDCYREMCRVLEQSGESNDEFMTPREFEKAVSENVPAMKEIISEITHLFEEARYSPHELTEEKREKALTYLENLKRGLK